MATSLIRGSGDNDAWREAVGRIRGQLQCMICLDTLTDPRILPCHHSFCLQCLRGLMRGRDGGALRCPNCAKTVMLMGPVDDLPVDFKLSSLLEYLSAMEATVKGPEDAKPALKVDESTVRGKITCPLCETLLTEPRCLQCGHTFCTHCIERLKPVNEHGSKLLSCPVCRLKTDVSEGVQSLPLDLEKLLYILTVMKAYHETGANQQVMAAILDIELSDDEPEPEPVIEQTTVIRAISLDNLFASQEIHIQISSDPSGGSQPVMMSPVRQPPVLVQPGPTGAHNMGPAAGEAEEERPSGAMLCLGCCACCLCLPCVLVWEGIKYCKGQCADD